MVVVANRLLLSDLDNPALPTIHRMLHGGAVGLMSPNCAGPRTEASVMLTANAGSPCRGGNYVKEFYDKNGIVPNGENAGQAYRGRTGWNAPQGSAVFLGLGQALRTNAELSSVPSRLGALGDALHTAGMKTSVIGNADRVAFGKDEPFDRTAAVLAMDSRGLVDYGALASSFESDATNAQSSRVLTGSAPDLTLPTIKQWAMVVVHFGSSTTLDELKPSMSDSAYMVRKAEMLHRLDSAMRELISRPELCGQSVVLISFSPPNGPAWDQLTPIIVWGSVPQGLLGSPTTRTPGLIAASDFAPAMLGLLNVAASDEMIGRCPTVVDTTHAPERLTEISTRVTANQRGLTPIAILIVALGALSFTPTALIVALGLKPKRNLIRLLKVGMVAGGTTFAALLLAVLAPAGAAWYAGGTAISMIALTAICFGLAAALRHRAAVRALPVVLVFGATALIIVADALTGCNLCKWCGPSSYQITAMRFYGIGNEYAGVLIPMAALAALFSPCRKWLVPVAGVMTVAVLGLGSLGANYGATAAATVTFVLLWFAVSRRGFGARHVALAFGVAIVAVAVSAVLDLALAGSAGSHAARATGLTEKLGAGYLVSIAMRKVLFNLGITFSAAGLHYALAFVPFLVLWFGGVQGKVRSAFKTDSHIVSGMKAVLVGAAAAFMLNDSGIVFAGIMIAITVLVLLYSLLEEVEGPHPSPPHLGEGEVG